LHFSLANFQHGYFKGLPANLLISQLFLISFLFWLRVISGYFPGSSRVKPRKFSPTIRIIPHMVLRKNQEGKRNLIGFHWIRKKDVAPLC